MMNISIALLTLLGPPQLQVGGVPPPDLEVKMWWTKVEAGVGRRVRQGEFILAILPYDT